MLIIATNYGGEAIGFSTQSPSSSSQRHYCPGHSIASAITDDFMEELQPKGESGGAGLMGWVPAIMALSLAIGCFIVLQQQQAKAMEEWTNERSDKAPNKKED
jgi:hypothetical protein